MNWVLLKTHPWEEPLDFSARFASLPELALLYSGRRERFSGSKSFLFLESIEQRLGNSWGGLPPVPENGDLPCWVGYLGYGMRDELERYTRGLPSFIHMPDFWLTRYARMFRFQHEAQTIEEYAIGTRTPMSMPEIQTQLSPPRVARIDSNFNRNEYEASVRGTLRGIRAGDFYQANITRKFFGEFENTPDTWSVFRALANVSPAPYSAFIKHGGIAIISSSPECFLSIDAAGSITSRPIKGSAPRGRSDAEDNALRQALLVSEKNFAENLMIVDLMRNDLARVSEPGSVTVAEQSALYSYATIHHLVSTVTAQKKPQTSAYDVVRAAFPPGSMTGAPKIAAIEWCTSQETLERGVYSGAIGWFGGNNTCDLSVVIRTLLIDGLRFEFQVGGGIVADSTPEDEWQETLIKARGIAAALGIGESSLAAL